MDKINKKILERFFYHRKNPRPSLSNREESAPVDKGAGKCIAIGKI